MQMKERRPRFDLQQRKIHLCMGLTKEERDRAWICFQPKEKNNREWNSELGIN